MLVRSTMYNPQEQREPSGCMEAIFYTRIVFGLLLVPFVMIFGVVTAVVLTFVALSYHPLLALLVLVTCTSLIVLLARWEAGRVAREMPPEDR